MPAGAARPSLRLVIPPCRWQRPLCSLLACLGINLLLLTLDRGGWGGVPGAPRAGPGITGCNGA